MGGTQLMVWRAEELISPNSGNMSWHVVDEDSETIIVDCGKGDNGRELAEHIVKHQNG